MPGKSAEAHRAAHLKRRSPVAVGEVIANKYRVEQLLAAGGMGVVAAAQHEALGQRVAIKFLQPTDEDEHATARFLREARAAARIQSEHVARVFDCGTTEGGVAYLVMEFLSGHDLAGELKERGPLPVAEAVDLLLQALDGIAEAHALGIVHRDIKPANLFLATRPGSPRCVKILDFGISKLEGPDAADDGLTATSVMLGSPRYMSPEQAQSSKTVDARSDIWSLGVVLYESLDGKSPFAGDTMGETLGRVLTYEPPSIEKRRPEVPEGLANVIARCFQRDRERRFRNVAELALALAPFGSGRAKASVDRIAEFLVGRQLVSGKLAVQPAAANPSPSGELRAKDPTVAHPGGSDQAEPAASTEASKPEQTAGNWARRSASDGARGGRIALLAVVGCAALAGALALGLAIGRSPPILGVTSSGVSTATAGPTPPATALLSAPPPVPAPSATPSSSASASSASSASSAVKPHPSAPVSPPAKRRPQVDILGASD